MVNGVYSFVDYLIGPMFFFMFIIIGLVIANIKYKSDRLLYKHFIYGLILKLIGCVAFLLVYTFYYGYGDTFRYFSNALPINDLFLFDPPTAIKFLFLNETEDFQLLSEFDRIRGDRYAFGMSVESSGYMVVRLTALFNFFTFKSYVGTSLCFAFFSFIGIWGLYRTFTRLYPNMETALAIPVLYFPSLFFWGSSIMKDSIVMGFLGLFTYSIYKIFFVKKNIVFYILVLLLSSYVLKFTKQYVIISYIPALIVWVLLSASQRLPTWGRLLVRPILVLSAVGAVFYVAPLMGNISQKYALETVLRTAEVTGQYIYRISADTGSAYSLGAVSYTPQGLLTLFPRAVVVSLYRPFLFEVKNPVMLMSAIESTIVLFFTLYVIFRVGVIRFIVELFDYPFLLAALTFSLFFAFAVGISSMNFGALARYKIPCLPFYGVAIIVPYMHYRESKKRKIKMAKTNDEDLALVP